MAAISSLTVPKAAARALAWLSQLSADAQTAFTHTITSDDAPDAGQKFAQMLNEAIAGSTFDQADEALRALISLRATQMSEGWTAEEVAVHLSSHSNLDISPQQRQQLRALLVSALESKPLARTAKAYDIAAESLYVYQSSRVLTDIRPVFGESPHDEPLGAIVTHTLKIDFHKKSGLDEIYLALSGVDLDELEAAIKRAKDKAATLMRVLERASVRAIDIDEEA